MNRIMIAQSAVDAAQLELRRARKVVSDLENDLAKHNAKAAPTDPAWQARRSALTAALTAARAVLPTREAEIDAAQNALAAEIAKRDALHAEIEATEARWQPTWQNLDRLKRAIDEIAAAVVACGLPHRVTAGDAMLAVLPAFRAHIMAAKTAKQAHAAMLRRLADEYGAEIAGMT